MEQPNILRRESLLIASSGLVILSGCIGGSSPEEEVADVIANNRYDNARDSLTTAFEQYEANNFRTSLIMASTAHEDFTDPLQEAQNGARSSDGRKEDLYKLLEEHLRLARGASHSLAQAADEQLNENQDLAQNHYAEARDRWNRSAHLADQLADELDS